MQDVDPITVKHLFEEQKLNNLTIFYKRNMCPKDFERKVYFSFSLMTFFEKLLSDDLFIDSSISFNDISSICLFGSVLHKHIPVPIEVTHHTVKKGGAIQTVEVKEEKPRSIPNDIDIFVMLKSGLLDSPKTVTTIPLASKSIFRKQVVQGVGSYGGDETRIVEHGSTLPLHISIRSISQFLNGINNGDEVSEYISTFGVPFVGQKNFSQTLEKIKGNVRKDMHKIRWKIASNHSCKIECRPIWWKNYNLDTERIRREAVNIPPDKPEITRFEMMEIESL